MSADQLVFWLFFMTLILAVVIGVWQLKRVRRSQLKRGEEPTPSLPGDAEKASTSASPRTRVGSR